MCGFGGSRNRVVTYVRRCPSVHCLDAVLLIFVDQVEPHDGRARRCTKSASADRDGVPFLAPPQVGETVADQRDVVVKNALVEGVLDEQALVPVG